MMSQSNQVRIVSPSLEVSADEQAREAVWYNVVVDLDAITLEIEERTPMQRTANGADVVWNYIIRRQGRAAALKEAPAGWVPLMLFEPSTDGFGPFSSLTQVVELDPEGQVLSMTVEGRLSRAGRQARTGTERFPYHAVLYRGVSGELVEGRTLSLMISEQAFLTLPASPARPLPRTAPYRRIGTTHNLEVLFDSAADKLEVFPTSYPSAGPNDRVVWDFKIRQRNFIPLILFYDYRPPVEMKAPQVNFGPFERLTMSRRSVAGSRLNSFVGHYHYEAAILSSRNLSLRFLSSGDPVVDNEGIGFQGDQASTR